MPGKYDPVNPVAFGAPIGHPNKEIEGGLVLSTVVGDNYDLFCEVARMWIKPDDLVMDVTYGRGAFWKQPALGEMPQIRHDIDRSLPYGDGVDCRNLPEPDESVDVVVFDPPYRASHGGVGYAGYNKSYQTGGSSLDSVNDVLDLYRDGIKAAARVLKPGGRLLVKCQDQSYSHRLHLQHLDVLRAMVTSGLELVDMFILVNQTRAGMNGRAERQDRARRNHSYLMVGAKPDKVIDPTPLREAMDKLYAKYGYDMIEGETVRLADQELHNGRLL